MHDVVIVGVPLVSILFGILLNQQSNRDLKAEVLALRTEMGQRFSLTYSRIDRVQADLSQFYRSLGEQDARLGAMEKGK